MQPYPHGELVVVLDCADLERAATFWSTALGYRRKEYGGGRYLTLLPEIGAGIELLLQRTEDPKLQKNRMHLDLRTDDLDLEVGRLRLAGATVLTDEAVREHGWRWHILSDPDGSEFCVLQPPQQH